MPRQQAVSFTVGFIFGTQRRTGTALGTAYGDALGLGFRKALLKMQKRTGEAVSEQAQWFIDTILVPSMPEDHAVSSMGSFDYPYAKRHGREGSGELHPDRWWLVHRQSGRLASSFFVFLYPLTRYKISYAISVDPTKAINPRSGDSYAPWVFRSVGTWKMIGRNYPKYMFKIYRNYLSQQIISKVVSKNV